MPSAGAQLARRHVPEFDGVIGTARQYRTPVRREDDRIDCIRVAVENAKVLASRYVPHLERPIVAAGQGHCAVGRECDRIDGAEMSIERADQSITAKVQSRYDSTSDHAEGNCSAQAEEEPAS